MKIKLISIQKILDEQNKKSFANHRQSLSNINSK